MKKILWFSRHAMSQSQLADLAMKFGYSEICITQVNGTAANVHVPFTATMPETGETVADFFLTGELPSLKELVADFDEVAAVLPIGLQQQILPFLPSKRLLVAKNKRIITEEGKVEFSHEKWEQITEIKIVVSDL